MFGRRRHRYGYGGHRHHHHHHGSSGAGLITGLALGAVAGSVMSRPTTYYRPSAYGAASYEAQDARLRAERAEAEAANANRRALESEQRRADQAEFEARLLRQQMQQQQRPPPPPVPYYAEEAPPPRRSHEDHSRLVRVRVPDHVRPNEMFPVTFEGRRFSVPCPAALGPDRMMQVRLPESSPPAVPTAHAEEIYAYSSHTSEVKPSGKAMVGHAVLSRTLDPTRLIAVRDAFVDESTSEMMAQNMIAVLQGDRATLVDGTLSHGLPYPYQEYVLVRRSEDGKVGRVRREAFRQEY